MRTRNGDSRTTNQMNPASSAIASRPMTVHGPSPMSLPSQAAMLISLGSRVVLVITPASRAHLRILVRNDKGPTKTRSAQPGPSTHQRLQARERPRAAITTQPWAQTQPPLRPGRSPEAGVPGVWRSPGGASSTSPSRRQPWSQPTTTNVANLSPVAVPTSFARSTITRRRAVAVRTPRNEGCPTATGAVIRIPSGSRPRARCGCNGQPRRHRRACAARAPGGCPPRAPHRTIPVPRRARSAGHG